MITAEALHIYDQKIRKLAGPCPECQSAEIKIYHGQLTDGTALADAECYACGHVWRVLQ